MRRERDTATGSRSSRQGGVAARRRLDQCRCAVGDIGYRRQGVFLDQCRCHRGPRLGERPSASRSGRACHSRRHRRDDRAHRRTQAGCHGASAAASPRPTSRSRRAAGLIAPATARPGIADVEADGNSRHCRGHCGRFRQGRCRKIDHRDQSGTGLTRSRFARRPARRRHLWTIGTAADRHSRKAAAQRRQENDPACALRSGDHVDRVSWSRKTPR
jgi:hypothetical protein